MEGMLCKGLIAKHYISTLKTSQNPPSYMVVQQRSRWQRCRIFTLGRVNMQMCDLWHRNPLKTEHTQALLRLMQEKARFTKNLVTLTSVDVIAQPKHDVTMAYIYIHASNIQPPFCPMELNRTLWSHVKKTNKVVTLNTFTILSRYCKERGPANLIKSR